MSRDTTVIPFRQPEAIDDPLSEIAREGARRMLAQVLIAEADAFVAMWKELKLPDGRDRVVRHGHGPQRRQPATLPALTRANPIVINLRVIGPMITRSENLNSFNYLRRDLCADKSNKSSENKLANAWR